MWGRPADGPSYASRSLASPATDFGADEFDVSVGADDPVAGRLSRL